MLNSISKLDQIRALALCLSNTGQKELKWEGLLRDFCCGPVVKTSRSNAGDVGLISGLEIKIPHGLQPQNQNINQKQYCNKFNKDFKNGPHKTLKKKKSTVE